MLRALAWTAGAVILVLGIGGIAASLRARRRRTAGGEAPGRPPPGPPPARAGDAERDAETLARAGRFEAAVHVLLLGVLDTLRDRIPSAVPEAGTSREIARTAPLPPAARTALGDLVLAVERSRFGRRPVDEGGYRACRDLCRRFRAELGGGG